MMDVIFPLVLGTLMVVGGIYTFHADNRYFKFLRTKGTENVFSPLAVWFGYFLGGMFVLGGITIICQAFFK